MAKHTDKIMLYAPFTLEKGIRYLMLFSIPVDKYVEQL